jgi:hypothetical protein
MKATRTDTTITYLTHRLAQAPPSVLDKPRIVSLEPGIVSTAAVVSDLLLELGGSMLSQESCDAFLRHFRSGSHNLLQVAQVACYLCHDRWLSELATKGPVTDIPSKLTDFLVDGLADLAKLAKAPYFLEDPEGREEMARLVLSALGLLPEGETEAQARDRLAALDSVERARLTEKTREAQKRAREIREAMARKAAEEAASKMTRE